MRAAARLIRVGKTYRTDQSAGREQGASDAQRPQKMVPGPRTRKTRSRLPHKSKARLGSGPAPSLIQEGRGFGWRPFSASA
jgi:hypothetical protein